MEFGAVVTFHCPMFSLYNISKKVFFPTDQYCTVYIQSITLNITHTGYLLTPDFADKEAVEPYIETIRVFILC